MLMPLDCHLFSCGGEINQIKLLFNVLLQLTNYKIIIKIQT